MNKAIGTALSAIGTAQLLKVPLYYRKTGVWSWKQLVTTGGMPSSHSAGVSALTTYIALKHGVRTVDFALSSIFGMIVMYDAMGIRRHAGEIAMKVNDLDREMEELVLDHSGAYHLQKEQELKEELGHMPTEVAGGALLGGIVGTIGYWLSKHRQKRKRA